MSIWDVIQFPLTILNALTDIFNTITLWFNSIWVFILDALQIFGAGANILPVQLRAPFTFVLTMMIVGFAIGLILKLFGVIWGGG